MNTTKLAAHIRKNYTASEQMELIAEIFHEVNEDPGRGLSAVMDAMREDEISEGLQEHFRNMPKKNRWDNPLQDFLFSQLLDSNMSADEIFNKLAECKMSQNESEYFRTAVQLYLTGTNEDTVIIKCNNMEKRSKLLDFVNSIIYPYYNEQQSNIFV